jgi:predicted outer membrane repeat protein
MIDSSQYGDTVWVKAGTYFPTHDPYGNTNPTDPRDKTFYLKNGVRLFGSFAGTETALTEHTLSVINANATILSGDIGTTADTADNCYHVLVSVSDDSTTVLDGFTITGGNAFGSGVLFIETYPLSQSAGAGLANMYTALQVSNCIFEHNHTGSLGGGMFNNHASPVVANCIFAFNTSLDHGGGMHNEFPSVIKVLNSVFFKNRANTGGGILNEINAVLQVTNCVFTQNYAIASGAAISSDSTVVTNCILYGNNKVPTISTAAYSIVEGATVIPGNGNTNTNPLFVDSADADGADNIWRTADDGLQVLPCSPAVDRGTATAAPALDIVGNARLDVNVQGISAFDIGAYENTVPTPDMVVQVVGDTIKSALTSGTFQWIFCIDSTNASGVSTNPFYVSSNFNLYALKVTEGSCNYFSDCIAAGPVSTAYITDNIEWKMFPNPSQSVVAIQTHDAANAELTVTDEVGKMLLHTTINSAVRFDVSGWSSGIYHVKVNGVTRKLLVQ